MSAAVTIRADGMNWPLETFIDNYGFTRLDWRAEVDAVLSSDYELEVVVPVPECEITGEGSRLVVRRMIGRHVDRHDAIAIKDVDGMPACEGCGIPFDRPHPIYASEVQTRRRFAVNEAELTFCLECLSDEWGY